MSETLPPAKDYLVEIDLWFLGSSELTDAEVRIYVLLKYFFAKGDKRRRVLNTSSAILAEILGIQRKAVESSLDRLLELRALSKYADETWESIQSITTGGREIAEALGFEVGKPPVAKLDTRPFFIREVSDRACRLWGLAAASWLDDVAEDLGWTSNDLKTNADELVALGIATYGVSKEGIDVVSKKIPKDGMRIVEFTSEELGRIRGSGPLQMATYDRLQEEKRRRDRSRGVR